MQKLCSICEYPFRDGDKLVAIMLSEYKEIESDVHYAIAPPTECVEIVHHECYDFDDDEDPYYGGIDA